MKEILTSFLLICLFLSCAKSQDRLIESQYGKAISFEKEEINIPIDDKTLTSYQVISCFQENENNLVYAYNSPMHSLDIFNLNDQSISHLPLNKEGENGVLKNVSGLYVHQEDSLWLYSQGFLYLVNNKGEVKGKYELPFPEGGFIMVETNFSMATIKLFYHPQRNSVFYLTVTPTEESATYIVYEYSLNSGTFKTFELKGSETEKFAGKRFGFKQFPNVTYTDQDILYNFPISSNIYRIDIETGKETAFGGKSRYTPNLASELAMPYDMKDASKHHIENIHFFEIQYDPYKNIYYRLHLDKTENVSTTPFRTLCDSKELYLTSFDKNFRITSETKLENNIYTHYNSWGVLDNGLFITEDNLLDENKDFEAFQLVIFKPQI